MPKKKKLTWHTEKRKLADLTPYPGNPRQMTQAQNEQLAKSLTKFDLAEIPAITPDGRILAGNQRVRVLKDQGRADDEVDVRVPSRKLTKAEEREYLIRSNRNTGDWDLDELANGFDMAELMDWGFDEKELVGAFGVDEVTEDEVPEPPKTPITKAGDLWTCGEHKVLCGDARKGEDVARVMGGEKANIVFTDPPYGVQYAGKGGASIAGDQTYTAIPLMFSNLRDMLSDQAWIYVCGGSNNSPLYDAMFDRYLKMTPRIIVWDKGQPTIRHNGYHSCYELIFYGFTEGAGARWCASRAGEQAQDVWHIPRPGNDRQHLTEKPVKLPVRAIANSSEKGECVVDPFLGSGTTMIAAEQLGRKSFGIEIEPAYVDVCVERWQNLTGKKAVRAK